MSQLTDQSTLGDAIQLFCLAALKKVGRVFPGSEVEPNGQSSAKLLIPAELGNDYVYLGIEQNGDLLVTSHSALASGRPRVLLGPFKPTRYVGMTVATLASKILALVKD